MSDLFQLAEELANPSGWRAHAACAGMDTETFFPQVGGDPSHALAVCRQCPVAQDCLDERLAERRSRTFDDGIFGGTTQRQRAAMRLGQMPQTANPVHADATEHRIRLRTHPEPAEEPGARQPQSDPSGFREFMRVQRSPRPDVGELERCGTTTGYRYHRGRGETPCHACTDAHRDSKEIA